MILKANSDSDVDWRFDVIRLVGYYLPVWKESKRIGADINFLFS